MPSSPAVTSDNVVHTRGTVLLLNQNEQFDSGGLTILGSRLLFTLRRVDSSSITRDKYQYELLPHVDFQGTHQGGTNSRSLRACTQPSSC